MLFQNIGFPAVSQKVVAISGVTGIEVDYGTAGDSIFLAGVKTPLASGDLVFH